MIFLILQGVLNFNVADVTANVADVTLCESLPSGGGGGEGVNQLFSVVAGHMKQDRLIFNLVMNETGWNLM